MEKTIKMNVWGKDKELTLEDYQGLWKSQILEFARLPMFCRYDKKSFDKTYDNYNKLKEIADEMVITAFNSRWEHQNK